MIKRWIIPIIALFLLFSIPGITFGLEAFQIKTYLTDQAGVLPEEQRFQLSKQLKDYAIATSNQILVVIIPSLQGETPEDYTLKLAKANKIVEKGKDNAVILLIAIKERKVRFEVGYGLEGVLPDGKTGAITREEITPYFQKGDYYSGLAAAIHATIKAITPDYQPGNSSVAPVQRGKDHSLPWAFLVGIGFVIFSFIGNLFRGARTQTYRRSRGFSEPWYWGGGGFGGGGFGGGGGFSGGDSFSGGGGSSDSSFGGGGSSGGW